MNSPISVSGVDLKGKVPSGWDVRRVKDLFWIGMGETILTSDLDENGKYPVYSATEKDKYFGYKNSLHIKLNASDLVVPARGNSIGHVKFVHEPSGCTQTTMYLKSKRLASSKYIYYYFLGNKKDLFIYNDTAIPQITVDQVSNNMVLAPPLPEQIAIADYLDKTTALIDKQRALLERKKVLLQEHKKALIHEAVTKGLTPGVAMKSSGVDWIGDMPAHWCLKRADSLGKFAASGIDKISNPEEDDVYMFNYLDVYRSQSKVIYPSTQLMRTTCSNVKKVVHAVKNGDILITPSSETEEDIGHAAIVMGTQPDTVYSYHLIRFRVSNFVQQNYVRIFWNSIANRSYLSFESRGTTRKILNRKSLRNAVIPVPPIAEQFLISEHLDKATTLIDSMHESIIKKLVLLAELRSGIIHEAVTRGVPA